LIVRDYKTLNEYAKAFSEGYISLLIVKGEGGLGKTYTIQKAMGENKNMMFNGHATPLSIYLKLFNDRTSPVIFDDVDSLLGNKINISLLKQLCEGNKVKEVMYNTTFKMGGNPIPNSIKCTNKVCLLCNDIKKFGKNMKALLTRAVYIEFVPTKEEVMTMLQSFKELDEEIYSFIETNLGNLTHINFRLYMKAVELKNAKLDWIEYLNGELSKNLELELIMEIMDMPKKERNQVWKDKTGRHVRTLQRKIKELSETI